MDSNEIFSFLELIAEEPGKIAKVDYLRDFLQDDDFRKVVQYAYDPLVTFGVLQLSETSHGSRGFNEDTWILLDLLKDRDITGNEAKDCIYNELEQLDVESQTLLRRILKKDLRGGFSTKSINAAMPGTVPVFPYMRCSTEEEAHPELWDYSDGVFSQEKADGLFVNVNVLGKGDLTLTTRYGQEFPKGIGEYFLRELCEDFQYHGEIVVYNHADRLERKISNGIVNSLLKGGALPENHYLCFFLWDMIPVGVIRHGMKYSVPYADRIIMLAKEVAKCKSRSVSLIPYEKVYSWEQAENHFEKLVGEGLEGTVLKKPTAEWKDGTSRDQVKKKKEKECDLKIIGFIEGKGKYKNNLGSIVCVSEDGEVSVSVSGMTDDKREEIWQYQDVWLERIITVKYTEVIRDKYLDGYSLFSPRFVEERFDKIEADSTDRILKI